MWQPHNASRPKANMIPRGVTCPRPAHVAPDDRLWRRRAEQYEGRRHHQLVRYRVQESAKCGRQLHLQPEQQSVLTQDARASSAGLPAPSTAIISKAVEVVCCVMLGRLRSRP